MQTCIREVKLYGDLAKFVGTKSLSGDIKTAADSIKFLVGNFPELQSHMSQKYYKVIVEDKPITIEELHYPAGKAPIKIIPVVSGEGGRGLGQILLGALLIGGAFLFNPALTIGSFTGAAGATPFASLGFFTKAAVGIGAGLVLNGVASLLTPVPSLSDQESDPESFAFTSPANVSRAGIPIPVIYGRRVIGSAVISAGIDIAEA